MINFKPKLPALLGALAVLTAGAAHAELLEYTFKAPDGAQRSLPPNANYANPTGNVSFALSAGIDRKVKVSVRRSDGTVVSTATSHLLGATDRITVGGKSYYGAELQLAAPAAGSSASRPSRRWASLAAQVGAGGLPGRGCRPRCDRAATWW